MISHTNTAEKSVAANRRPSTAAKISTQELSPQTQWTVPPALLAFALLLLAELFCFGSGIKSIGFYLDDWSMYSNLSFCAQDLLSQIGQALADGKVLIRPLEGPYFAILHYCFGTNPLGHHAINYVFEVFGAWFFYLALSKITGNKGVSLASSLIYLLYPNHDATHYWITASSVTVSLTLYTASLWQMTEAATSEGKKRLLWLGLSAFSFWLSVFNYESFLPMAALSFMACFYLLSDRLSNIAGFGKAFISSFIYSLPYALVIANMWVFQRFVLPALGQGYNRPLVFDAAYSWQVVKQGFNVSFSPHAFWTYWTWAGDYITNNFSISKLIVLGIFSALSFAVFFYMYSLKPTNTAPEAGKRLTMRSIISLAAMGFLTMVCSYTIFCIAPGYLPSLETTLNRVNSGAAIGASLIFAAGILLALKILQPSTPGQRATTLLLTSTSVCLLFTVCNWDLAKPWMASWKVQKHIREAIVQKSPSFRPGDSVLLANTPRYVLWSPVFDGVWDFQQLVQMDLKTRKVKAGVVSERMIIDPASNNLADISAGVQCAKYPFKRMFVFVPNPDQWFEINSAQEFINVIANKGLAFGLPVETIDKWRTQSKSTSSLLSNFVQLK